MDVADVVQQDPDHAPRQMHEAAETHELAELQGGNIQKVTDLHQGFMSVKLQL